MAESQVARDDGESDKSNGYKEHQLKQFIQRLGGDLVHVRAQAPVDSYTNATLAGYPRSICISCGVPRIP
ncbi:unnamed protein product [Clonostachys rosea]|uniref:Uncharacterized protein n=1 Tax=Bionectria ochroleuca TaxID=29856 RepID=A0ABY6V0J7_BIOOC|nr:unnamed protein product [Clonostachys rosea]